MNNKDENIVYIFFFKIDKLYTILFISTLINST